MNKNLYSLKNSLKKFMIKFIKFFEKFQGFFISLASIAVLIAAVKFTIMQTENKLNQKAVENHKILEMRADEIKSKLSCMDRYIFVLHMYLHNYLNNINSINKEVLTNHIIDRDGQFSNSDAASDVNIDNIFNEKIYENYINCSQIYMNIRKASLKIINNNLLKDELNAEEYNILSKFLTELKKKHIKHNECFKNIHDELNTIKPIK